MKKRKLTPKQREFVKHYTNIDSKETFGNATQSAMKIYNVNNIKTAAAIGNENLQKPEIKQAIEKKILKKEELQEKQGSLVEKLERFINENGISVENAVIVRELGVNIERNAKLNGDLIDRVQTLNMTVDLNDEEVMNRLSELLGR